MSDIPATAGSEVRPPPTGPPGGTLRRDIASAYLLTGARIITWAVISALVYRRLGPEAFAMLALIRSTIGLLAYASLGLAPAMVRALAEAGAGNAPAIAPVGSAPRTDSSDCRSPSSVSHSDPLPRYSGGGLGRGASDAEAVNPAPSPALPRSTGGGSHEGYASQTDSPSLPILSYATPNGLLATGLKWKTVYSSGEMLAILSAGVGAVFGTVYALNIPRLHSIPWGLTDPVIGMAVLLGFGMALRLMSEAPSSLLQVRGLIARDNGFLAVSEAIWLAGTVIVLLETEVGLPGVALAFVAGNFVLLLARVAGARWISNAGPKGASWPQMRRLLTFGVGVAIAQAADFLYAPTDYILINALIGAATVAVYAPAVQIDGGLFLIVNGLATVLMPHSALAHAAGNRTAVRRYYVRGTLASIALLVPAALLVWLAAPLLLRVWFGQPMPATVAILPIVLLNTVIGGSSTVGRSVLLAMGQVRAFSTSVVIAGLANVLLSFVFVRYFNLGLTGIILGTIVAVVGRCAVWMPWYVLGSLNRIKPRYVEQVKNVEAGG